MRKILLAALMVLSGVASGSDKMTEKNKKWLLSQPGVSSIGCNSYEDSSYSFTGRDGFYIKESSFKKQKLFDNSNLICDLWSDLDDKKKPTLYVIEESKIDGVKVKIFQSGGSGTVGDDYSDKSSWQVGCKTDVMTDEYNCYVYQKDIYIIRDKNGYRIAIGTDHFPNTKSYIRIDGNQPIESGSDGVFSIDDSQKIISSLSSKSKVITRFTKWPYERPIDGEISMSKFDVSKKVLDIIFEDHK